MSDHTALATTNQNKPAPSVADGPVLAPLMDIYESDHEYLVVANLPGVTADALTLSVERGELTLEAKRERPLRGGGGRYGRRLRLPDDVDVDKIDADLEAGMLSLHLPKRTEATPRQITVRSS